jgi:hypothetical protein
MKNWISLLALIVLTLSSASTADEKIAWYGNLRDGLTAARATGKPILLVSAAVQCKGVSGIY